jgi:hypothetical protein
LKCLHQADFASFCDFGIGFSSCSDSVVFVCVSFYRNKNMLKCKNVIVNILVCPQSLSFCPVDLQYVQCLCSLGWGETGKRGELVELTRGQVELLSTSQGPNTSQILLVRFVLPERLFLMYWVFSHFFYLVMAWCVLPFTTSTSYFQNYFDIIV